jgi:hypothetical protein
VQFGEELRQAVHACEGGDVFQVWFERRQPAPVNRRLVHAGGVVVADLSRRRVAAARRTLEDPTQDLVVPFLQLVEAAPARAVGRNGIGGEPSAAGELVEVGARIDRAVERGQLEARGGPGGWS